MKNTVGALPLKRDLIYLTSGAVALKTLYGSLPFSLLRNEVLIGLSDIN